MKLIKNILIVIVVLIAIPLIVALFLPKEMKGHQEIVINQPKAQVFDYVKYLKNQSEYSVWDQIDPEMTQTFEGTDGTVGFTVNWESDHEDVGNGSQKVVAIDEGNRIDSELYFEGAEDPMYAYMTTEAVSDDQTKVTWVMQGDMPFPFNLVTLFYDVDEDLKGGLENLKEVLEAQETKTVYNKAYLLEYYETTKNNLEEKVQGLSEAQMQYKPADTVWSVGQCLDHIIKTEGMLFGMVKTAMEQPANPERRAEIKSNEEDMIAGMVDRTQKFKAPDAIKGENAYTDASVALGDFTNQRKALHSYIEGTSEQAMRDHITDSPSGALDVYQFLLFTAGHSARHTLQIEEVMASEGFPE